MHFEIAQKMTQSSYSLSLSYLFLATTKSPLEGMSTRRPRAIGLLQKRIIKMVKHSQHAWLFSADSGSLNIGCVFDKCLAGYDIANGKMWISSLCGSFLRFWQPHVGCIFEKCCFHSWFSSVINQYIDGSILMRDESMAGNDIANGKM